MMPLNNTVVIVYFKCYHLVLLLGLGDSGTITITIFCNPNIYPNPFAAKLLITIRDDRIRLTSEAELTRLIEDLEQYLENYS